eukprot:2565269-Rhodomonas_salina.2
MAESPVVDFLQDVCNVTGWHYGEVPAPSSHLTSPPLFHHLPPFRLFSLLPNLVSPAEEGEDAPLRAGTYHHPARIIPAKMDVYGHMSIIIRVSC